MAEKRKTKQPDFHLIQYLPDGKPKRLASLWIYDDPKYPEKEGMFAKGKTETNIQIPSGVWINLFPVNNNLKIQLRLPNRY